MRTIIIFLALLASSSAVAQDRYLIDWNKAGEEALDHFAELIRINTSNPPGNETEVVEYLDAVLETEGISTEIFALDPDRANLVARVKGNGSKRPLLLMAHTDVVGVQVEKWTEDPFGGLRKDGWLYGRGTLDDKDNVAAALMVMMMLKRLDVPLDRDVIFLAEAGEEGTPEWGINFLVEKHWDAIAAEYALAEGGNGIIRDGRVDTFGIETTEKAPRRATLVASGTPGHGSVPRNDNAVVILANAVVKAAAWRTEIRLNDTTRTYFQRMAEAAASPEEAYLYENIGNPELADEIAERFLETFPFHNSVLRTSVVPTILDAGFRKNVIPSEAKAVLDIRMLPDEDPQAFYALLAEVIDDPRVEIVPEKVYRPVAPPSEIDNEMFQTLERVAVAMYPEATILPVMSTGATDMAQLRDKGVQSYGIGPARTIEEINSGHGAHGDNERIQEAAFVSMLQYMWRVVIEMAATP
jgi:acetylornithine deacetylase/succinyl-diaminopimelate desuccinylase-like protein